MGHCELWFVHNFRNGGQMDGEINVTGEFANSAGKVEYLRAKFLNLERSSDQIVFILANSQEGLGKYSGQPDLVRDHFGFTPDLIKLCRDTLRRRFGRRFRALLVVENAETCSGEWELEQVIRGNVGPVHPQWTGDNERWRAFLLDAVPRAMATDTVAPQDNVLPTSGDPLADVDGECPAAVPFRHVISLGTSCATAQLLKETGLRRYSSPFDWLFASPRVVEHSLRDDFGDFVNRDLWVNAGSPSEWTQPILRDEYGCKVVVAHHDLTRDEVFSHLSRCVRRLRAALSGGERKLFVVMTPAEQIDHPHFGLLFDSVAASTQNYKIVGIGWKQDPLDYHRFTMTRHLQAVDQYEVHTRTGLVNGLRFEDEADNATLQALLRRYSFDIADAP